MGDTTGISWTHRTVNFWRGCKKISPGCKHCYMFTEQTRYGHDPTIVTRTKTWGQPKRWQKEAEKDNANFMVFTCSWSDFFIESADAWRPEAWEIIKNCPNLTFQILTKRPHLIPKRLPLDWGKGYNNVWLGVSVESERYLWRMDVLRDIPARVRFLSAEPLLGSLKSINFDRFHWCITGAESGKNHRLMDLDWVRELRDKCLKEGVAFFHKQGSHVRPGMNDVLDGKTWKQFPRDCIDQTKQAW